MGHKLNCILLIDDDLSTNFFHEVIIKRVDCTNEIVKAHSAQEGLDYLNKKINQNETLPELIFLDINMPIMDGWDFIEEYKQYDKKYLENTVLIMLTTSIRKHDIEKANTIPLIKHYQTKPLSNEIVKDILEQHVCVP